MNMTAIRAILFANALLASQMCCAQADVHFSQFYECPIIRNPGLTGVSASSYKVSTFFRSQWSSISTPYNTYMLSGETKIAVGKYEADYISLGMLSYLDRSGTSAQQITSAYPTVSYNKSVNSLHNSYLTLGASATYRQYSFDPNKLSFNSQYQNGAINTSLPSLETFSGSKASIWNVAVGVNFNSSIDENNSVVYCIGASGFNLIEQPLSYLKTSDSRLNLRANVNAAISIALNEDTRLQIHGNYARQGNFNETMGALLWSWSPTGRGDHPDFCLTLGASYRWNDAIAPTVRLNYKKIAFGACYDVNTSAFKAATNTRGATELSVSFNSDLRAQNNTVKSVVCPRFSPF